MSGAGYTSLKTVLVVWEHGGQLGHLARLLPIMRALRASGARVVFATARAEAATPYLQGLQIEVLHTPQVTLRQVAERRLLCPADILLHSGFLSPPDALVCVVQWLALFDEIVPDAVLVDASPMAQYAANVAGLHTVVIGHGFELPPPLPAQSFAPWMPDHAKPIAYSDLLLESALKSLKSMLVTSLGERLNAQRVSLLPDTASSMLRMSQPAICVWPELDHYLRADQTNYIGPIWHDLPNVQALSWPDRPGPKVLCYLTLHNGQHDLMWEALKTKGANVLVLSLGGSAQAAQATRRLGITVHEQAVAVSQLMTLCDAFIGTGGAGLTSMALFLGKSVMLMPTQHEQGLLAYRLINRGLALSSMNPHNKSQIEERVTQLLTDPLLRARIAQLGQRYLGFTPQQAIDRVINLLRPLPPMRHMPSRP